MRLGITGSGSDTVAEATDAERRGFAFFALGEHVFFHGEAANGFVNLAAAAAVTQRIQLLSSITLLPLYPAALATKMAVSLDEISHGRFNFGVGAGGEFVPEFLACGIEPATRFKRLDEALSIYRHLCTGEPVNMSGDFATLADVRLDPPPRRSGGPPVWVAGRKEGSMRRAGRFGDVWMPYLASPRAVATGLARAEEEAQRRGRPAGAVRGAYYAWLCVDGDGSWARRTAVDAVSRVYQQDFTDLAPKVLISGSPDEVRSRLAEYAEAGVDELILSIAAAPNERLRVLDTIEEHLLQEASISPDRA